MTKERIEIAVRFWAKVDKDGLVPERRPELGPCWNWIGARNNIGYGIFTVERTNKYAHRVVLALLGNEPPVGLQVDHLCRNRRCVNPAHLEIVTARENARRSDGPSGINARKTHCKHGHEFTPENTSWTKKGRRCRSCKQATDRRSRAARLAGV